MLDQMVFAIRRLICELDGRVFPGTDPALPTIIHRDVLTRQPEWYSSVGMPLDKLIQAKDDSPQRRAALNLNLLFAPDDYVHDPVQSGHSAQNPVILRRILDPLASEDPRWAAEGVQLAGWFLANVQVPKGKLNDSSVTEQIKAAIAAARIRHGIP